jgi:hypothetical protein
MTTEAVTSSKSFLAAQNIDTVSVGQAHVATCKYQATWSHRMAYTTWHTKGILPM